MNGSLNILFLIANIFLDLFGVMNDLSILIKPYCSTGIYRTLIVYFSTATVSVMTSSIAVGT